MFKKPSDNLFSFQVVKLEVYRILLINEDSGEKDSERQHEQIR